MSTETAKKLTEQAKQFRALQKVLSSAGDFKSMQTATICAGLAEVAESLALEAKHRNLMDVSQRLGRSNISI